MLSRQQKFSMGYFPLTFLGLILLQTIVFAPQRETLSYRDFKTLLKAGKVVDTGWYFSVSRKKSGKWLYVRDAWDSDKPAAPTAPAGN